MHQIIITDLTRFKNEEIVCTAGVCVQTGQCIRPMPYLRMADCKRLNILPGAILSGTFARANKLSGAHQEDMNYEGLQYIGPCSSNDFENALKRGMYPDISQGFDVQLTSRQKSLPENHQIDRSIITIQVNPNTVSVVEDDYNPGKVKLCFTDSSGHTFDFMAITDLGFHMYAKEHFDAEKLIELNTFLKSQKTLYLRIGLSRPWKNAYWMQVNGVYTFPDFLPALRSYN